MSEPMNARKRFFVSGLFVVLFIVLIPLILLYSLGYRLDKDFSLFPTGGAYVFYPESRAQVYVNGELGKTTSLFERGIFIDNLNAGTYDIEVRKEFYRPWKKTFEVAVGKVAEGYPFLIPEVISTSSVPRFVTVASGASVTNSLYGEVVALFATTTEPKTNLLLQEKMVATSSVVATTTALIKKNIEIVLEKQTGRMVASWKGSKDAMPFYFCDAARLLCEDSFVVIPNSVKRFDFYPGRNDVLIYNKADGVYVTELDSRTPQNTFKLISGNVDFRESGDRVFVKEKASYYEIIFTASTTLNTLSI